MALLLLAPLLFALSATAQSTTTATILLPDVCVTQSTPTVTVLGANSLTTYSYGCTVNSALVSSGLARASSALADASSVVNAAQSKVSDLLTNIAFPTKIPGFGNEAKRDDNDCFGFGGFDVCIPWEVTQGPSYWAVHYTAAGVGGISQECSFGDGGVASGAATCTGSGRLDTAVWGDGTGVHTKTFSKEDVDKHWVRNTVAVTAGGPGKYLSLRSDFVNDAN
jgi:hypothetical protein